MRLSVPLTAAALLAIVAGLASVASAAAKWTATQTCFPARSGHIACVTTGPGSDLSLNPWAYLVIGVGLFALGGLFLALAGVKRGPLGAARARLSSSLSREGRQ